MRLRAFGDLEVVQETKISRQEISADLAVAEGYESFFSFAKGSKKGRVGYSGQNRTSLLLRLRFRFR